MSDTRSDSSSAADHHGTLPAPANGDHPAKQAGPAKQPIRDPFTPEISAKGRAAIRRIVALGKFLAVLLDGGGGPGLPRSLRALVLAAIIAALTALDVGALARLTGLGDDVLLVIAVGLNMALVTGIEFGAPRLARSIRGARSSQQAATGQAALLVCVLVTCVGWAIFSSLLRADEYVDVTAAVGEVPSPLLLAAAWFTTAHLLLIAAGLAIGWIGTADTRTLP
jgi:hypothetical protein